MGGNKKPLLNFFIIFYLQKLGESCEKNCRETKYVETIEELTEIVVNHKVEVTGLKLITHKHLLVETKTKQEFHEPNRFHNPVISAFVTAYARLYLLDTLERLGNLVLYVLYSISLS